MFVGGKPGKISVTPTKGLINQRDLALAYSPGVAAACDEIRRDPSEAQLDKACRGQCPVDLAEQGGGDPRGLDISAIEQMDRYGIDKAMLGHQREGATAAALQLAILRAMARASIRYLKLAYFVFDPRKDLSYADEVARVRRMLKRWERLGRTYGVRGFFVVTPVDLTMSGRFGLANATRF